MVAAVVDQHVNEGHVLLEPLPESAIGLIPHVNVDAVSLIDPTRLLDIDTVDRRLLAEIALPHLEAAPAVDADFHDDYLATDKSSKVLNVEIEVVTALVDAATFAMRLEVRP
jgi:hypothetical protein